jgi:hypothetical protein
MIQIYESKNGDRAVVGITPTDDLFVAVDANGIGILEGTKEAFKNLAYVLKEKFGLLEMKEAKP